MSEPDEKLPSLNVNLGLAERKTEIVKAEQLVTYYNEILDDIRHDREEVNDVLKNFMEMVINEGDSTQGSKEALVNLIKIKSEMADKKTRVMDLLLRAHMRDRSIPGFIANQYNQFNSTVKDKKQLFEILDEEQNEQPK